MCVPSPFDSKVSVSTKIKSSEERARLKQTIQSIKPNNCGVIVRTVAEGKRVAELDAEMKVLASRWEQTLKNAQKAKQLPALIYEETSRTVGMLRDLFNPSYENIYVNDGNVYDEVKNYVSIIAPEKVDVVKHYKGKLPIFDNFDITRQIKSGFGRTVSYKHGAYLIIEHTEALHVVDVNSGNRTRNKDGQEANALDVNLGAADELARQLRLRDMGGIIVVDFIDMKLAEDRQKLYEHMCENMKRDRARHNILPLSKFGLMQITRQRVRPVTEVKVEEACPTCHGTGTIKSSFLFDKVLEGKIKLLFYKLGIKNFTLHVHPYVAAYLNQGLFSIRNRWQWKYGFGVKIIPSQKLAFLQYEFYDAQGQEIDMKEEVEIRFCSIRTLITFPVTGWPLKSRPAFAVSAGHHNIRCHPRLIQRRSPPCRLRPCIAGYDDDICLFRQIFKKNKLRNISQKLHILNALCRFSALLSVSASIICPFLYFLLKVEA